MAMQSTWMQMATGMNTSIRTPNPSNRKPPKKKEKKEKKEKKGEKQVE